MQPLARVRLAQTEPRSRPAWAAWLGLLLLLAPVVAYFHLAATLSVEVPYIDDYDAVVDPLTRTPAASRQSVPTPRITTPASYSQPVQDRIDPRS